MERRFFNAKEIAVYVGLSEETIRKWACEGRIPFSKFGAALRFDLQKIEPWLKKKENAYVQKEFADTIPIKQKKPYQQKEPTHAYL